MILCLILHGANYKDVCHKLICDLTEKQSMNLLKQACNALWNPDSVDSSGRTILYYACQLNRYATVLYLLREAKCNPSVKDKEGIAAIETTSNPEIITALIEYGVECEQAYERLMPLHNKEGQDSINSLAIIKSLIASKKWDPNRKTRKGMTALHYACKANMVDIANYVLSEGHCNPNVTNKANSTPLQLASSPEIIKELLRHGADTDRVYNTYYDQQIHLQVSGLPKKPQSSVKVFIVGNLSVGKSTLTKALQKEMPPIVQKVVPNSLLRKLSKRVSGVNVKTAGVDPHDFLSKGYGQVTFYDFAGHKEFHGSHAALLQHSVHTLPPIFIIVIKLSEMEDKLKEMILYWLSFIDNRFECTEVKPCLIIVGSHIDELKETGEKLTSKEAVIKSLSGRFSSSNVNYVGFVAMDCQYPESEGMKELRIHLSKICRVIRTQETISFSTHCFLVYLIEKFKDSVAVKLKDIHSTICKERKHATPNKPLHFLPDGLQAMERVCRELNDRGHVLFLKDEKNISESWIIINKAVLLSEVTGTIFAPHDFKEYRQLATSTGVVPLSELEKHFVKYDTKMLVGFLTHLEYCQEIIDTEVLQLIYKDHSIPQNKSKERYYFFPALIKTEGPENVWKSNPDFSFRSGWIITCCQEEQFLSSRFLQVLLHRLAFSCAFPQRKEYNNPSMTPAIERKCSVWKGGIHWGTRDGIEALVEVVENKSVIFLIRSCQGLTPASLQLRSTVIQKVIDALKEFCPKVKVKESLIDPLEICHYNPQRVLFTCEKCETSQVTTKSIQDLTTYEITEIAETIFSGKPSLLSTTGRPISIHKLLVFEPYMVFDQENLVNCFNEDTASYTDQIPDSFLLKLDKEIYFMVLELLKPESSSFSTAQESSVSVTRIFSTWKQQCEGTFQCLRQQVDQFSIFAGRNIKVC